MLLIQKYFPNLSPKQIEQFSMLGPLYQNWNERINVISRKDMENFYERHVLHSLGIACVQPFAAGAKVMDVGTGGGFPGIPLAIMFPDTEFILVDSIGKKITVVKAVAEALGLSNVKAFHERAEKINGKFDFVVSRAVTDIVPFTRWVSNQISRQSRHDLPNGILYLKGGDLSEELSQLNQYFSEPFFETKKVLYVKM
jgi:16S rRNA (guanine527-N7)-methyltransferase